MVLEQVRFGSNAAISGTSAARQLMPQERTSGPSRFLLPDDGRLEQLQKLQIKAVASPGFGPIFGLLVRNGLVFGIGGFEPQPPLLNPLSQALSGFFVV